MSKKRTKNKLSDFWIIDKFDISKSDSLIPNKNKSIVKYIKLASLRRSIADFVKIVTKKNILVEYIVEDDTSFTDGEKVFISAKINNGNIDSTVGLALHEGSHIKLTDFGILKNLKSSIPNEIYEKGKLKGASTSLTIDITKQLLNWIEDRRIDNYIYIKAPGYRGYYHALYDRYFNSNVVTKALESNLFRNEDLKSYLFRIINLINEKSDINALKSLKKIYKTINLKNIDRLKSTSDSLNLALKVLKIIFDSVNKIDSSDYEYCGIKIDNESINDKSDNKNETENDIISESNEIKNESNEIKNESDEIKNESDEIKNESDEIKNESDEIKSNDNNLLENTEKQLEKLRDEIKKQKNFINGEIEKKGLSRKEISKIDQIKNSGTELKNIKLSINYLNYPSVCNLKGYDVIVIKKVTEEMLDSGILSFISEKNLNSFTYKMNEEAVLDGIRMGRQLGKKLQIRNDEKITKYTRKESGKIDRRLIAELGFKNNSIFQQTFIELYTDAILHLSIDISGSMGGSKLANALKLSSAICQAASMTNGNLNVVVDVRGTNPSDSPFVAIIYDSRVDNIIKVKKLFPRIRAVGSTPEGLCFAAIQDLIESSTSKLNSYFVNISDGRPYFIQYSGDLAVEHTRGEVNKMRKRGIKILSYFISKNQIVDKYKDEEFRIFKKMYGNSAECVDVNGIIDIAKTLNKVFLADK